MTALYTYKRFTSLVIGCVYLAPGATTREARHEAKHALINTRRRRYAVTSVVCFESRAYPVCKADNERTRRHTKKRIHTWMGRMLF